MTREEAERRIEEALTEAHDLLDDEFPHSAPPSGRIAEVEEHCLVNAILAAVAEERARCAAVIKSYQSPRAGILLARQPGVAIAQILEEIDVPDRQPEPEGRRDG